jgi:YD repeat-containing protein
VLDFIWQRKYRSQHGPNTAMGNGWDFSYNIFLEASGPDLVLHNGTGRADRFTPNGSGQWVSDEFFLVITQNPDTSYTAAFPDKGAWNFDGIEGEATDGLITSIVDRNGNTMTFVYDGAGRLTTITDDLARNYTVAYNAEGLIESVIDFSGRAWTYAYYKDGDAGGSAGDLKSVTTPAVTGTPNGNDFPTGKTTVYTYAKGLADERLNHNLLTVNDPKGQTFLVNEYAATSDVADLDYDRVARQSLGDPGDVIDLVYTRVTPVASNNFASMKTIVNDREGHVKELFYRTNTYGVMCRELTGLADPDLPTDDITNRPGPPLRPGDPPFYETRWTYDTHGQVVLCEYPNQNAVEYVYDETNLDPRLRGDLLEIRRDPGTLGGEQAIIIETFEYEPGFGGCCARNFVTRHVDGRGNDTVHSYDGNGNCTGTSHRISTIVEDYTYNAFGQMTSHILPDNGGGHRRTDEFHYYAAGPQSGYLRNVIMDAGGFNFTNEFQYDARGNVVAVIDPKGNDTQFLVNALDQVVRTVSREISPGSGVRYETDIFYDANNNIVRVDIENKDENGVLETNTHFTTTYDYEILNHRIRTTREIDASDDLVTEIEYDANRNPLLLRGGEAVAGTQPGNVVQGVYDERDLVFQVTRAPSVAGSGGASTDQCHYDGNGNRVRYLQGLEGTPRETPRVYDGYNRIVSTTDPMGNVTSYTYDANGNSVAERVDGELQDLQGSAGNIRLWEGTSDFDDMDRLVQSDRAFFDTLTGTPLTAGPHPGLSRTEFAWTDLSRAETVTDDNNHVTHYVYDSANRLLTLIDAASNSVTYLYDPNSNVMQTTAVDKSDGGAPDETFHTQYTYDGLDRRIRILDNDGNQFESLYDSRGNTVVWVDAMRPMPTDPGNIVRCTYDGLNRKLQTERILTDDGTGTGTVVGSILTGQAWDESNRLVSRTDGNGNATSYTYDDLNRLTRVDFADNTSQMFEYDQHDDVLRITDANGTVIDQTFDLLNRLTNCVITPASGVIGTTFENFGYDGLSRIVGAEDDDSILTFAYDSLSRLISETLNGQTKTTVYDGAGNQLQCVYPGGRTVTRTYDVLNRVDAVSDGGGQLGSYDYIGRNRIEQREASIGGTPVTRRTLGYDNLRRLTSLTQDVVRPPATGNFDGRTYTRDPMWNVTSRTDVLRAITRNHAYDSIYRILGGAQASGAPLQYTYDDAGNRTTITVGGGAPAPYSLDSTLPDPGDFQMNQYTTLPDDTRLYDANGNLITIDDGTPDQRDLSRDYRNRLVRHLDTATGIETHYTYDAMSRRIGKVVDVTGTPRETRYFYEGRDVIEEQDGAGVTAATYVKGPSDLLTANIGGTDYIYHANHNGGTVVLNDLSGRAVETTRYGDFGSPSRFDGLGIPIPPGGGTGNNYQFRRGMRFDDETGFYFDERTGQTCDPSTGRYLSRQPSDSLGNNFTAFGNNPWSGGETSRNVERSSIHVTFTDTNDFESYRGNYVDLQFTFENIGTAGHIGTSPSHGSVPPDLYGTWVYPSGPAGATLPSDIYGLRTYPDSDPSTGKWEQGGGSLQYILYADPGPSPASRPTPITSTTSYPWRTSAPAGEWCGFFTSFSYSDAGSSARSSAWMRPEVMNMKLKIENNTQSLGFLPTIKFYLPYESTNAHGFNVSRDLEFHYAVASANPFSPINFRWAGSTGLPPNAPSIGPGLGSFNFGNIPTAAHGRPIAGLIMRIDATFPSVGHP